VLNALSTKKQKAGKKSPVSLRGGSQRTRATGYD
jgi:hypothetical protein